MGLLILALGLITASPSWAAGSAGNFAGGVSFDVAFGSGSATIENPDNTHANYRMLNVEAIMDVPIFEGANFAGCLLGGVRYLDLENTANTSNQSEAGNLLGPGMGFKLRAYRFFAKFDYYFMVGRHYAVGALSGTTKYQMPMVGWSVGYSIPINQLAVSVSYSQSKGAVPKSSTHLSKDSPYVDKVYWLRLTYSTAQPFVKFLSVLF